MIPPTTIIGNYLGFMDTVSSTNGNNDGVTFCGNRAYSFSPSWVISDWSGSVWTFETSDTYATLGELVVTIDITLEDYPDVKSTHTFTVNY